MHFHSYSVICFQITFNPTESLCLRCLQSPIDSVMLISQYKQQCENKTAAMSITSLHIIYQKGVAKKSTWSSKMMQIRDNFIT